MACRELAEQAGDYLEGSPAGARAAARFEAHLEECPYCTEYLGAAEARCAARWAGIDEGRAARGRPREPLLAAFRERAA